MTVIAISPIFNKIDHIYHKRWWKINHLETLKLSLECMCMIPFLLWQASSLIHKTNKLVEQMDSFDKELYSKMYKKLSQVRDIHLDFGQKIKRYWLFSIYSNWNDKIIADIDDILENIYFAMDEEFRSLTKTIANRI